ncbi:thiamine biosynthesis protein ThiC [Gimesia maris DSM 8797]|nr:thiamine biosynthesis protein ThiC [Gimesia maris DSM 8797]
MDSLNLINSEFFQFLFCVKEVARIDFFDDVQIITNATFNGKPQRVSIY